MSQQAPGIEPKKPSHYRPDVDGLRAIAVIAVILYHLDILLFGGGYTGVDVFLVISGYLITNIIRRECKETGGFRFKRFYARRIRRLFPALFFTLILTFTGAVIFFSPTMLMNFAKTLPWAIFSASNIHFYNIADYFNETMKMRPLLHTWSLSVEEQFYMFWPFLLFVLYKIGQKWLLFASLTLLGFVSFGLNFPAGSAQYQTPGFDGNSAIFFLLPYRIFEFAIGAALVWCKPIQNQILNSIAYVLGLILIGIATFVFTDKLLFPGYYALVPCLGGALMIWSGQGTILAKGITWAPVVYIGKISYSLYLIHWPLIVFWKYQVGSLEWFDCLLICVITFGLSVISYHFVEQPFRTKQLKLFSWSWGGPAISGLAIMLALCFFINLDKGWRWRIDSSIDLSYIEDPSTFNLDFYGGRLGYRGAILPEDPQNPPPADIVILGDSHGKQYVEGLYELIAKPNNQQLYTSPGSGVLLLPGPFYTQREDHWMKQREDQLIEGMNFIKEGNTPMVVVAHEWSTKIALHYKYTDPENKALGGEVLTMDDLIEAIFTLKEQIGDSELVVIGQVPTTNGVDIYDMLSRPRWIPFITGRTGDYAKSPIDPRFLEINRQLKEAADRSGEFTFLDPIKALSDGKGNATNIDANGRFIYSDTHHLSIYGSLAIIEYYKEELEKLQTKN